MKCGVRCPERSKSAAKSANRAEWMVGTPCSGLTFRVRLQQPAECHQDAGTRATRVVYSHLVPLPWFFNHAATFRTESFGKEIKPPFSPFIFPR